MSVIALAQTSSTGQQDLVTKIDAFNRLKPPEKLYLQFDKPYYAVGDTIWFKGYLLNQTLSYSPLSSRMYVELINDSAKVVQKIVVPVDLGLAWGNLVLNGMGEGSYTIRAYTNWMRNFGEDSFFSKPVYVADPKQQNWLINTVSQLTGPNNNTVRTTARFKSLNNQSVALRPMQLKVLDGKKIRYRGVSQTSADGVLDLSFSLPDNQPVKNLALVAQDKNDSHKAGIVPVAINRAKDVDVQFLAEGGYLISGLPAHVGFKAVGEDGRGVNIKGQIRGSDGQDLTTFESMHKGLGTVDFTPQPGVTYTANIVLPDGQTKEVQLPLPKASGTSIKVRNPANRDTIEVTVYNNNENNGGANYLIGQSNGIVCFGATIPASKPVTVLLLPKKLFATGLAHISLLNAAGQPLNERITFIDNRDELNISITPGRKWFAPHDSIPLQITVLDPAGKPVVGSFSVAVSDDNQVKTDNTGSGNILSRLLMTSDLKGYVEDPGFYISGSKDAWTALDALLITQGWIGYDWKTILEPVKPLYAPEFEYQVSGKITNLVGKPVGKADVILLATGKHRFIKDTVTGPDGRFIFGKFPQALDSTSFVLEAVNARRKVLNSAISVDEMTAPAIDPLKLWHLQPWYVNGDTAFINYVKTNPVYHREMDKWQFGPQGRLLNAVTIKGNAMVRGSENLNGNGEADQVIDQTELESVAKMTLTELLEKKVDGFRISVLPKSASFSYLLKDKKVQFVFDGVNLDRFYEPIDGGPPDQYYQYVKSYLDYFNAEDIKGIEVLYSLKYTSAYNARHLLTSDELMAENPAGVRGSATAFIEITTRSGNGPFTKRANGIFVYKPTPLSMPKEFYRPRYSLNSLPKYGDLRSTIHWAPQIVTNKQGQATVSFYAADKPSTYTIVLEGADLKGKIGFQTTKITIGSVR